MKKEDLSKLREDDTVYDSDQKLSGIIKKGYWRMFVNKHIIRSKGLYIEWQNLTKTEIGIDQLGEEKLKHIMRIERIKV